MPAGLGIGLFLAGLVFLILVWAALRFLPRAQSNVPASLSDFSLSESSSSRDAVIILQHGGRVDYMNAAARSFFDLRDNEPYDLERLARRVRPADDFLDLCVQPGNKRVTINGKLVEVSSFEVPGAFPMMLVSLRSRDVSPAIDESAGTSEQVLRVVSEFSQSIAFSLDLNTTINSILDYVSRLVPSDVLELKLWDQEDQSLATFRFQELNLSSSGVTRARSSQFGGFTDTLVARRMPVFHADTRSQPEFATSGELIPIHSYLGIPLLAGGEFVGVLEAGQTTNSAFGARDLELLQLISGQTAVAIRNARLYEDEQKRGAELAGLANLNQSLGTIRDTQDLFARLVESIAPLFPVDITGFLLYDEEKRTLEGKVPFRGLPPHFIEI